MIYTPREDSFLLEKEIKKLAKDKSVLDIGSGSGIQAKAAISAGAKSVLASDIDKEAIEHLKSENIPAIKSNLFSKIKGKFDLIAFNPPYLPEDKKEGKETARITTGGKKGDEIILKFLKQAIAHMNKEGLILLVLSSLTPKNKILLLLKKLSLKSQIVSSQSFFFEKLELWKIMRG